VEFNFNNAAVIHWKRKRYLLTVEIKETGTASLKYRLHCCKHINTVLEPFEIVTKELEAEKEPTIHNVYHCYCMLEGPTCGSPKDTSLLQFLKARVLKCLAQKFKVTNTQYLVVFPNPKFKSLVPLNIHEQNQACNHVRESYCSHSFLTTRLVTKEQWSVTMIMTHHPMKGRKLEFRWSICWLAREGIRNEWKCGWSNKMCK